MTAPSWTPVRGRHARVDPEWPTDEEWEVRMRRIGEAAAPLLNDLLDEFPASVAATVCTGDGFNLCAVGLGDETVGQIAALSSSLHSVAQASVDAVPQDGESGLLDVVSIQARDMLLLNITFEHPLLGTLILTTAVNDVTLGELLLHSRMTAAALRRTLADL